MELFKPPEQLGTDEENAPTTTPPPETAKEAKKSEVRRSLLQYSLPDCNILRFFPNFRKNTPKNNTKPENIPGLLHFFDIFVSAGSECCS